jgi:hypothetical protein
MQLKYLRLKVFQSLTRVASFYAREQRMRDFAELMGVKSGLRILDLGGSPTIWQYLKPPLDITILNLPGQIEKRSDTHHRIHYVEGDACRVDHFQAGEFDIVFSNSVIEHVGPEEKQREFASEVRRLGKAYWVQTPSIWFPIEAHSGMPFWWFYPAPLRRAFLRSWRKKLPAWTTMVEETRVLSRRRLRELFPEARIRVEFAAGLPKSYCAYCAFHEGGAQDDR